MFHGCDELYRDWPAAATHVNFTNMTYVNNFGWQKKSCWPLDWIYNCTYIEIIRMFENDKGDKNEKTSSFFDSLYFTF